MIRQLWEILEDPDIDNKEEMAVIQKLVDTGEVWGLEGHIGRMVHDLIEAGYLQFPDHRTYDYWGNPFPTRAEWEAYKKKLDEQAKAKRQIHILTKPETPSIIQKEEIKTTIPEPQKDIANLVSEDEKLLKDIEKTDKEKQRRLRA